MPSQAAPSLSFLWGSQTGPQNSEKPRTNHGALEQGWADGPSGMLLTFISTRTSSQGLLSSRNKHTSTQQSLPGSACRNAKCRFYDVGPFRPWIGPAGGMADVGSMEYAYGGRCGHICVRLVLDRLICNPGTLDEFCYAVHEPAQPLPPFQVRNFDPLAIDCLLNLYKNIRRQFEAARP